MSERTPERFEELYNEVLDAEYKQTQYRELRRQTSEADAIVTDAALQRACKRIADLERQRDGVESVLAMAVGRLGGAIEETAPSGATVQREVHRGNFLQRIDALREAERQRDALLAALTKLAEANSDVTCLFCHAWPSDGHEPGCELQELLEQARGGGA